MSIRDDLKAVLKELSPILAGFKLALIVVSYFGLGSVAKWVVSHWYPFTRWVWDRFCEYFTFPVFPVVVKDSLTALVFFLPLGVTALVEFRARADGPTRNSHRLLGAFFGSLFLIIICKDVLSAIADALATSPQTSLLDGFMVNVLEPFVVAITEKPTWWHISIFGSYFLLCGLVAFYFHRNRERRASFERYVRRISKAVFKSLSVMAILSGCSAIILPMTGLIYGAEIAVLAAIAIMFIILSILGAAVVFAPRKLYITAGACIAFVLAALFFEFVVAAIAFIEKAPSLG